MNTFNKFWGVVTPAETQAKIDEQGAVLNGKTSELKNILKHGKKVMSRIIQLIMIVIIICINHIKNWLMSKGMLSLEVV